MKKKILFTIAICIANLFLYAQVNLTNGLVAFYPLDGNANDSSVNALNGNLISATPTTNRFGQANKALDFNGTSDAINVAHNNLFNLSGDKTISAWYKITDSVGLTYYPTIIYKQGTTFYPTFGLYLREDPAYGTSRLRPSFIQGKSTNNNKEVYTKQRYRDYVNQWVHLLASYSTADGYMRIYFNGVISDSLSVPSFVSNTSTDSLQIGRGNNDNYAGNYFKGSIDDIRIYSRILNDAEIAAVNAETFTTSIKKITATTKTFKVFPNTFSNAITVFSFENIENNIDVTVFDIQGKQVYSSNIKNGDSIELNHLKQGTYVLQILNNDIVENHKIIKE